MPPSEDGSENEGAGWPTVRVIAATVHHVAVERRAPLCYHWRMRWPWLAVTLALALALAACGRAPAAGPAWPKSAGTVAPEDYRDDGGESIQPHPHHVAAIEVATDPSPPASAATADAGEGTSTATDNPATPGLPTGTVETIEIQLEDIQIGPGGDIIITP